MRCKLFVYGTLKRGFANHFYLQGAKFLGEARTKERYPMVAPKRSYPYLIDRPGIGYHIEGELYEIDHRILKRIDRLEEYPLYYTRKTIVVECCEQEHRALCYFLARPIPLKPPFLEKFESQ